MVDRPCLRSGLWQKRATTEISAEHPNERHARVAPQPQDRQVERDPPERLLKMPAEGLLAKGAVAGHVGEVDAPSHAEQDLKQFYQEPALPRAKRNVVNGRHFCPSSACTGRCATIQRLCAIGRASGMRLRHQA